ncbi:cytochrome-c peroxidase [Salinarimonas ramus]|uniref:Methylamine utilization protein MauG n=1 Tax=Salinarimonas ramus TaxID=690164 RepID=A0A917QHL1_9HYPH|nr:cytochrome c peroxidase [Salinarimonas ramus]GGK50679.1 methylamine utilization protein MauG [Salinarimonas ramus]
MRTALRPTPLLLAALAGALVVAGGVLVARGEAAEPIAFASPAALGEALFFDPRLSRDGTMACATCHDPQAGFADPRDDALDGAVSLGGDGVAHGRRNAPTLTYAQAVPAFHRDEEGYRGGLFHDGRAVDLADQAGRPMLDQAEMMMADEAAIVAAVRADPAYEAAFDAFFAPGVLDDPTRGFGAIGEAIAAFERTETFAPYSSKYDRWLAGEAELDDWEELGRVLFFSQQFTNCALCHLGDGGLSDPRETFTDHRYHNIGTPAHPGLEADDAGLAENPAVAGDPGQAGRYRTPTLRNVAVTGPYMHNGVFADLRTVILFYNTYNTRSQARRINPETGEPFGPPPHPETLALEELEHGPALDDQRIDALVAFLKTLTDERYEALLSD